MASNWRNLCIDEMAQVIGGGTPKTDVTRYWNGAVPWLTPKDLANHGGRYIEHGERMLSDEGLANSSAKLLPAGAVLLTTRAPVGYVAIARRALATNQGFRSLVPRPGFVSEFLYYLLATHTEYLRRHAGGTTFQELTGSTLRTLTFRVPDEQTQLRIAAILGAFDDKIELNRRMNATLEAMARALFKSWFVDFDPVRAKMEGRWRRGQSLPGLPAHLWDLFPDRLVDSELGEIPEGWETATLGELCEKPQYGYTASAAERPVGPHFLRITDINKQPWIEWSSVPYCDITEEEARKYLLRDGDVVIARMADPGHAALVEDTPRAVFASYLIRFRPLDPTYGRFLQYWLRSPLYWELVHGRKTGSTRATLNAQMLSDLPLTVPGKGVAAAFRTIIDAWRHKVVHNVHNSSTLAALRDALLPKLLSGEIDVSALDGLADPPAQAGEVP